LEAAAPQGGQAMTPAYRQGELVMVEADGRTAPGVVTLASPNGRSLVLEFEAVVGGHLGAMPVIGDDAGGFRDLLTGRPVKLWRRAD
jgi:hypothetical protein